MSRKMTTRLFALLSAIIYFILGGMILTRPGVALASIIFVIGIFLLIAGIFLIVDGARLPSIFSSKTAYIFDGVLLSILGAIFIFGNAFINITVLAYLLVFWFMVSSIIHIFIVWAIGGWVTIVSIILNMFVFICSLMALADPMLAQGVLIWYLALQFIMFGVNKLIIVFAPNSELDDNIL